VLRVTKIAYPQSILGDGDPRERHSDRRVGLVCLLPPSLFLAGEALLFRYD